jgi:hypothetical protein
LYVYGGWAQNHDASEKAANPAAQENDTAWFIQGGIERKFIALGTSTIFGEYRHDDAGSNIAKGIHDSNINFYAAGIVQNIDAAAMDIYVIYRHADGDINFARSSTSIDDFDAVQVGSLIKF